MLKNLFRLGALVFLSVLLAGCFLWNPNIHSIRIFSAVSDGILENLKIGEVSYGDVDIDAVTSYQEIAQKSEQIVTLGADNSEISRLTLRGFGTHMWTLTIAGTVSQMTFTLTED